MSAPGILTFNVYGTLIDRVQGLAQAWRTLSPGLEATHDLDALTARLAMHERILQDGPYRTYRTVLAEALLRTTRELGVVPSSEKIGAFAESVSCWPAFPDAVDALSRLRHHFRLAVISNCDDESFAMSSKRLGVEFDYIVTAEQARSYKPSLNNFHFALGRMGARAKDIMHVGHSLTLDVAPACRLGMACAWIDRCGARAPAGKRLLERDAFGLPAVHYPDLEIFSKAMIAHLHEN